MTVTLRIFAPTPGLCLASAAELEGGAGTDDARVSALAVNASLKMMLGRVPAANIDHCIPGTSSLLYFRHVPKYKT